MDELCRIGALETGLECTDPSATTTPGRSNGRPPITGRVEPRAILDRRQLEGAR